MSEISFRGAWPIGETDVRALPVREVGPAIGYYTRVLGFELVRRDGRSAALRRGEAEIGLAENGGDPEQASVYFEVGDVEALRRELDAAGIDPSPLREGEHDGRPQRVFFAKEPFGVCFCFGQTG